MKKLFTTLMLGISCLSYAQTPTIEWQHTFGGSALEQGSAVRPTSDGGYIVTGISASNDGMVTDNHGGNDHWVLKLDALGAVEWKKSLGGSLGDQGYNVRQTSDGGYIFSGYSGSSDGDVSPGNGSLDFWIVKTDGLGNIEWENTLGGSGAESAYDVIQTLEGGYGAFGFEQTGSVNGDVDGNHGSFDYWFCKLDVTGALQWQRCLGGSTTDQGFSVVQTEDSGYVFAGYSSSTDGEVTGNHGGNDYWIVKIDKTGVLLWEKSYGGTASDRGFNIAKTDDGGFIVNGVTASSDGDVVGSHGGLDLWVLKLDENGDMEWQKCLGGSGDDFGRDVLQTPDGGYVVCGKTNSTDGDVTGVQGDFDYWIVKLDPTGAIVWQKTIGGTAGEAGPGSLVPFMTISQTMDGKFIFTGSTFSVDGDVVGNTSTSGTDDNYWVVKLYGCPAYSQMYDTICNGASYTFNGNDLTISGSYFDTLVAGNGCDSMITLELFVRPAMTAPVITNTSGVLGTDTYVTYQWLLSGTEITGATGQTYTPTADGDYTVAVTDENGCSDTSVVFTYIATGIRHLSLSENITIFPNPAKDVLTILYPYTLSNINVSIYSIDGRAVVTEEYHNTNKMSVPMNKLSPGVYILKVADGSGLSAARRIIKQ